METKISSLLHHNINMLIAYEDESISHTEAWKSCGNGVWVYDSKQNKLFRNSIGSGLPYTYHKDDWDDKSKYCHRVIASSHPLWVWWGQGCTELEWGDINVALPKLEIREQIIIK